MVRNISADSVEMRLCSRHPYVLTIDVTLVSDRVTTAPREYSKQVGPWTMPLAIEISIYNFFAGNGGQVTSIRHNNVSVSPLSSFVRNSYGVLNNTYEPKLCLGLGY